MSSQTVNFLPPSYIVSLTTTVQNNASAVTSLSGSVSGLNTSVGGLNSSVTSLSGSVSGLNTSVGGLNSSVTSLSGSLAGMSNVVKTAEVQLTTPTSSGPLGLAILNASSGGMLLKLADSTDLLNAQKVRTYNVGASELLVDYDALLAKLLAVLVDMCGSNQRILNELFLANKTRSRLIAKMMWETLLGSRNDPTSKLASIGSGYGKDLMNVRWRELEHVYDNLRLLRDRARQLSAGQTGQSVVDNCEHWIKFLRMIMGQSQSQGQAVTPIVNNYNFGLQNRYIMFGQNGQNGGLLSLLSMVYGLSTTGNLTNTVGNPLLLDTITAYNTITDQSEWQRILDIQDYLVNETEQAYIDFENSIQLGYRPMDHSIFGRNIFASFLYTYLPRDSSNPWNTSRFENNPTNTISYGMSWGTGTVGTTTLARMQPWVPLGASTGTFIYNQMRSKFNLMQANLMKIVTRLLELYTKTLGQVLPYQYPGNTEPFIRSRYTSYATTTPDSPYKDLAGILPVYPPSRQLEAREDWARAMKQTITTNFSPTDAFKYIEQQIAASTSSAALNAALPFLNAVATLDNPSHVPYIGNQFTGGTGVEANYAGLRYRSRIEGPFTSPFGDIKVYSASSGTISTIYPHQLVVGDQIQFWGFESTGGLFGVNKPYMSTGNNLVFSSAPNFVPGDAIELRDLGSSSGILRAGRLAAAQTYNNPSSLTVTTGLPDYAIDSYGTGTVSLSIPANKLSTWVERTVKSVSLTGTDYYVQLQAAPGPLTGASIVIPNLNFVTDIGQLVCVQNKTSISGAYGSNIFTVTSVADDYTFSLDKPVDFTDPGVRIEYGWLTSENKIVNFLRQFWTRMYDISFPRCYSNLQNQRFATGAFYYGRWAAGTQVASEGLVSPATGYYNKTGAVYRLGAPIDMQARKLGWHVDTVIHEHAGHGSYVLNNAFSNKTNIPEASVICPFSSTFIEGQASAFEGFIPAVMPELDVPHRRVLNVTSNKVYYASTGYNNIDSSVQVGDLVMLFSSTGADYSTLTSAGFSYPSGGKFTKVTRVASKGSDGGGSFITLTNANGSALTLSDQTFTDVYMISTLLAPLLFGNIEVVTGDNYQYTIALGDIALNYFGVPATVCEFLYQSVGATEARNTNGVCQHMFYGWGKIDILKKINDYVLSIQAVDPTFNVSKFYSLGHVKGFVDAMQLEGNLDKFRFDQRVVDFTNYVIAGGDPTRYYAGQV